LLSVSSEMSELIHSSRTTEYFAMQYSSGMLLLSELFYAMGELIQAHATTKP